MTADTPEREQRALEVLADVLNEPSCKLHPVFATLIREGATAGIVIAADDAIDAMLAFADTELSRSGEGLRASVTTIAAQVEAARLKWQEIAAGDGVNLNGVLITPSEAEVATNALDWVCNALAESLASDRRAQGDGEYVMVPREPTEAALRRCADAGYSTAFVRRVWGLLIAAVDTPALVEKK